MPARHAGMTRGRRSRAARRGARDAAGKGGSPDMADREAACASLWPGARPPCAAPRSAGVPAPQRPLALDSPPSHQHTIPHRTLSSMAQIIKSTYGEAPSAAGRATNIFDFLQSNPNKVAGSAPAFIRAHDGWQLSRDQVRARAGSRRSDAG